jgi:hypothetical protein
MGMGLRSEKVFKDFSIICQLIIIVENNNNNINEWGRI